MAGTSAPQHHPTQRELDDLELLTTGALAPLAAFNQDGSPVTLALPDDLADAAVELVDAEGLPLARVSPDGEVTSLTHAQYGPFRSLYLSVADARRLHAGSVWVPVSGAIGAADLERIDAARRGAPVVLLALVGEGTPEGLSSVGLIRATRAAAGLLGDHAHVVAVPLASHGDPEVDHALGTTVMGNYAGDDRVLALAGDDDLPEPIADVVAQDQPGPDEVGLVLFFTGLSGSGKSTLARALVDRILEQGERSVTSLDGDVVRRHLSAGLTFSAADRETNIRRIGWVAAEISRHGGIAVCSPIAPFDSTREDVRRMVDAAGGEFFLIHVATPLEECERRDRKGLYAKARRGEIPEFTGISSPYEEPEAPDVRVDTTGRSIEDALADIESVLADRGFLHLGPAEPYDAPDAAEPSSETGTESTAGAARTSPTSSTDQGPLRVLFVCTANICRSAYLDQRARAMLDGDESVVIASAGTHGFADHAVDEQMGALLDHSGVVHDRFRSRRLTRAIVTESDLVLTAEDTHRTFILDEAPEAFKKVFTVAQFAETVASAPDDLRGRDLVTHALRHRAAPRPEHNIADPYRRGPERAREAATLMDGLLEQIVPRLTDRRPGQVE